MSNLRELPPPETDVRKTLEDMLAQADGLELVMVLALDKEGKQLLRTSIGSMHAKSFLIGFLNAWWVLWYGIDVRGGG